MLICILSLAMRHSLEMWMRSKGLGGCARKLLEGVRTVKSMDVIVPVKREETEIELCLRTVARIPHKIHKCLWKTHYNIDQMWIASPNTVAAASIPASLMVGCACTVW